MEIVKVNRHGNALRVTIPAGYARQLGLSARDHVYVRMHLGCAVLLERVPRELRPRSSQGEK